MGVIYVMIALSVVVAVIFLVVFIKLVKSGQYEDLHTPSVRMLFEDEIVKKKTKLTKP